MKGAKKILIVEDEEGDIDLMLVAFRRSGLEEQVAVTRNGVEGLDYLYRRGAFSNRPEGNPRLVFMDLKMPKMSGLEVLKKMRADKQFASVAVVIFSSSRDDNDKAECLAGGANKFAVKPIDFVDFSDVIKGAIDTYLKKEV